MFHFLAPLVKKVVSLSFVGKAYDVELVRTSDMRIAVLTPLPVISF